MDVGLIILIVTLVAFAAMITFMLATGFKNQWPAGERVESTYKGHKLTLITGPETKTDSLPWDKVASHFVRAMWATSAAFEEVKEGDPKKLAEGAVLVLSEEEYEDRAGPFLQSSVSFQVTVPRRIGHGPLLVVMRASLVEHAVKTGEPIIHEFIHGIGGDYYHKDETWWNEFTTAPDSVQARAQSLYRD